MSDDKTTPLNIRSDKPTAISSRAYGTGVDAVGFNLSFIALKNPKLAVEIIRLYSESFEIKGDDPSAPDEDLDYFNEELSKLS